MFKNPMLLIYSTAELHIFHDLIPSVLKHFFQILIYSLNIVDTVLGRIKCNRGIEFIEVEHTSKGNDSRTTKV